MKRNGLIGLFAALMVMAMSVSVWGAERVISFEYNAGGVQEEVLLAVVDEFNAMHPDVEVQAKSIVGSFGGGWFDQLLTRIATDVDVPDVYFMEYNKALALISNGRILQVDQLIQRDQVDLDDLVPAGIEGISFEGRKYGLPGAMDAHIFFVNMDRLLAAGFDLPSNDWTTDDLITIGRSMTQDLNNDGSPEVWGVEINPVRWTFPAWQTIFGGRVLDDAGEVAIDRAPSVEALQFALDLVEGYGVAPNPEQAGWFPNGNIGLQYQYSWFIRDLRQSAEFEWDILPLPIGPAGKGNMLLGGLYMIDRETAEPEMAWEFVKYLYSPEVQARFAREAGSVFPRKSFFIENVYAEGHQAPTNWAAMMDSYLIGASYPAIANLDYVRNTINDHVRTVFQSGKSPASALAAAADDLRVALEEVR